MCYAVYVQIDFNLEKATSVNRNVPKIFSNNAERMSEELAASIRATNILLGIASATSN